MDKDDWFTGPLFKLSYTAIEKKMMFYLGEVNKFAKIFTELEGSK